MLLNLLQDLLPLGWCSCNPPQHIGAAAEAARAARELTGAILGQTGPTGAHLSQHRVTQLSGWDLHILLWKGQLELWEEQGPFPGHSYKPRRKALRAWLICIGLCFSRGFPCCLPALQRPGEQHSEKPWAVPLMRRTGVEKRWKPGRISSPVGVGG